MCTLKKRLTISLSVFCLLSVVARAEDWILYSKITNFLLPDQSGLMALSPNGGQPIWLSKGIHAGPRVTRNGQEIVYSAPHPLLGITIGLMKAPLGGGQARPLTSPSGIATDPSFSPDGTEVVYQMVIPAGGGGGGDDDTPTPTPRGFRATENGILGFLGMHSPIGPRQLPAPPPNGNFIAVARMDGMDGGSPFPRPIPNQGLFQSWLSPDWHPFDVNRIAASIKDTSIFPGAGIYIIPPNGSNAHLLFQPFKGDVFSGVWEEDSYPTWSPDGNHIAYVRQMFNSNLFLSNYAVHIVRADGSDAPGVRITPDIESRAVNNGISHIDWSPDGQWLVFSVCTGTDNFGLPQRYDLFMVRRDGSNLKQLTNDGNSFFPTWHSGPLPKVDAGQPPNPIQSTPTPFGFLPTPTPGVNANGPDLDIYDIYIVADDGNSSFEDDVKIANPQPGQNIKLVARIRNNGNAPIPPYNVELYIDGALFNSGSNSTPLGPGMDDIWNSASFSLDRAGNHTFEWRFVFNGDVNPANNTRSMPFSVGTTPAQNTPTPTPPQGGNGLDLAVQRVYMVIDDGNNNLNDDVEITNPQPNQAIRFMVVGVNNGTVNIPTHTVELYVDGQLFNDGASQDVIAPGATYSWFSLPWSAPSAGNHTFEWRFIVNGDVNPANNTQSMSFTVGSGGGPTPTIPPTGGGGDLVVLRVFLVNDDGGGSFDDDVEVTDPRARQLVRFMAEIENRGSVDLSNYQLEIYLDGALFGQGTAEFPLKVGTQERWRSGSWTTVQGAHTVEFRFIVPGDSNPNNNALRLEFNVNGGFGQPSPTATPPQGNPQARVYEFGAATLAANGWAEIPGGFTSAPPGIVDVIDFQNQTLPESTDRRGLRVVIVPPKVAFIYAAEPISVNGPVLIKATVRSDDNKIAVALVALKGNLGANAVDGSIAYVFPATTRSYTAKAKQLVLLYEPDEGTLLTPALQVSIAPDSLGSTLYVDKVEIIPLSQNANYPGSMFFSAPTNGFIRR